MNVKINGKDVTFNFLCAGYPVYKKNSVVQDKEVYTVNCTIGANQVLTEYEKEILCRTIEQCLKKEFNEV